ncbi:MAG TPA: phosphatase PAP2 family protein [Candidatus Dormibacteraeota bacterium]
MGSALPTTRSYPAIALRALRHRNRAPVLHTGRPDCVRLAIAVGVSRVHLGVHFPSDAAVAGVIGSGSGTFSAWVFKKRAK